LTHAPSGPTAHSRRAPILGAALALTLALGACNIVAPVAYLVHGPAKTGKVYELDETRSVVVFVDDRNNVVPRRALRMEMALAAQQEILEEKLVQEVVSAQSAMQVASAETYSEPMTIAAIGRAVDADVVIYATVDRFTLSVDGQSVSPAATLRVKLIESADGERLWPQDRPGFPLSVSAPARPGYVPETYAERMQLERDLADLAGRRIARLFYDWVDPGKPTIDP